jgi:hypothetical protein
MSTTFVITTGLSFILSTSIFALSLFSFTALSLWLNTIVAGLTIIYHGAIIYLSCRRTTKSMASTGADGPRASRISSAAYSVKFIMLLFGAWVVALGISIQVTVMGPKSLTMSQQNAPWNKDVQVAETILLVVQTLIVGSMMANCIKSRRSGGGSTVTKNVREMYEKHLFLPSPVVCRSTFTRSRLQIL